MAPRRLVALALLLASCAASGTEEAADDFDPAVVRIAAIGDSITSGQCAYSDSRGDQSPGTQVYTYRYYLQQHFEQAGLELGVEYDFVGRVRGPFLGCGVIEPVLGNDAAVAGTEPIPDFDYQHEGRPGATAAQLLVELQEGIGEPLPDLVLLQVGTNDVFAIANQLEFPWEPPPELIAPFETDLRNLIGRLRSINPGVAIGWATVPPCGFEAGFCDNPIIPVNETIRRLAAELSTDESPIVLVDHFEVFDVAELWDSVHPTDAGDQVLADSWWASLRPLMTDLVASKAG